jgi:DNA-binding GntR family transcriptional regulator
MPDSIGDLPFPPARVRRAASEPLYAQLARDLAAHIGQGTLAAGRQLPPEPVLARAYEVNRLTVREALASLARQGLVRRVQGVGSFVADAPVRHRIDGAEASLTASIRRTGSAVRRDVLEAVTTAPEAVPGGPFDAFPGLVTLLWVRCWVDGVPWSLTLAWLPASVLGADVAVGPDTSLSELVRDRVGLRMRPAGRAFTAVPAGPTDAEHLDVATGAPILVVTGSDADQHGRRIAQVAHRIRGDRVEYAIDLRGKDPS